VKKMQIQPLPTYSGVPTIKQICSPSLICRAKPKSMILISGYACSVIRSILLGCKMINTHKKVNLLKSAWLTCKNILDDFNFGQKCASNKMPEILKHPTFLHRANISWDIMARQNACNILIRYLSNLEGTVKLSNSRPLVWTKLCFVGISILYARL